MRSYNGFSPAQRNAAQAWPNDQWRRGVLPRPSSCCACGQDEGIIDAHAENYSRPFTAEKLMRFPLCYRCHLILHCRFQHPAAWDKYRAEVRRGVRFQPIWHRDFDRILTHLSGQPQRFTIHEPPAVFTLDDIHEGMYAPAPKSEECNR